ncbi:NAD-dependent deacetylase [Thermodesulfobacteriota bacterium]
MHETLQDAAKVLAESRIVIGFTGAGISVESGIPDFRTKGNFWEGFDPATFEKEIDNKEVFDQNPGKVWQFFSRALQVIERAEPNDAHKAMAWLGCLGRMSAIITQNVDELHQQAGSENVIEIHGSLMRLQCLQCGVRYSWEEVRDGRIPPCCRCGTVLKPEVPLFGDEVNLVAFSASRTLAMNAQTIVLVGTHGNVAPVNRIPLEAKEYGATIVEINREKSRYTDRITDYFLQGKADEILPELARAVDILLLTCKDENMLSNRKSLH